MVKSFSRIFCLKYYRKICRQGQFCIKSLLNFSCFNLGNQFNFAETGTVIAWGLTDEFQFSPKLLKANVPVIMDVKNCTEFYKWNRTIGQMILCAGGVKG